MASKETFCNSQSIGNYSKIDIFTSTGMISVQLIILPKSDPLLMDAYWIWTFQFHSLNFTNSFPTERRISNRRPFRSGNWELCDRFNGGSGIEEEIWLAPNKYASLTGPFQSWFCINNRTLEASVKLISSSPTPHSNQIPLMIEAKDKKWFLSQISTVDWKIINR